MKILKEDLLPLVESARKIIKTRTTLPSLSCFLICCKGGSFTIRASNLDQEYQGACSGKGDLGPVCVRASSFYELVSNGGDSISMTIKDAGLEVESGWTALFPLVPVREFPEPLFKGGKEQGVILSDLADGIEQVAWARSSSSTEWIINGIHVNITPQSITCEATNRKAMGHYMKPAVSGAKEFIVPGDFASELASALRREKASLHVGDNSLSVTHSTGHYSCKLIEGHFINTKGVIGMERKAIGEIEIKPLINVLRMCQSLGEGDFCKVHIEFRKDGILVEMKGKNHFGELIPGQFEPLSFHADIKVILPALQSFRDTEKVNVHSAKGLQVVMSHNEYSTFMQALRET